MENYPYNSSYPESGGSSPRSREIDFDNPPPWDESQSNQPPGNYKVKFLCSYGGKIHPRPHDNQLSYIGGETKILAVDRNTKFGPLLSKLIALCESDNISFKYQLPGEDLDALISVTNDDDLEHMMHEYERLYRISPRPARLRIFIFPNQSQSQSQSLNSSVRSFGSDEVKSEKERFVEALNTAPIITAPPQTAPVAAAPPPQVPASNTDLLFGMERANAIAAQASAPPPMMGKVPEMEPPVAVPGLDDRYVGLDPIQKHIQDLQRLRVEEQHGIYRRKSEDSMTGGLTGGEYYKIPEKAPPVSVPAGGVPYWTDKPVPGGAFPASTANNEQPVYMIQTPAGAYHAPMVRSMPGGPNQGYYTVQRLPPEAAYREHQQIYGAIPHGAVPSMAAPPPSLQPQKPAGYSDGYGMVRPATTAGMGIVTEGGYAQMAYDSGSGRQVIYAAPPGAVGAPPQQYQAMGGALHPDQAGVKGVPKVTQTSV
ncbi:uncharacterized protein LOC127262456 [Andrographis paniculata]|uniref:uncharacterized protein LOC127262456 n=1 Tax=Andrographis paniculata TaxID=175694 RepID=UPI0021E7CD53|nr:uncharacterized protein LOC127262456 [Andrographis paniculata]